MYFTRYCFLSSFGVNTFYFILFIPYYPKNRMRLYYSIYLLSNFCSISFFYRSYKFFRYSLPLID